jgi:hypothetical protein
VEEAVDEDPGADGDRPGVAVGVGVGELTGDPVAIVGAAEGLGTTTVAVLGAGGALFLKISAAPTAPVATTAAAPAMTAMRVRCFTSLPARSRCCGSAPKSRR